VSHPAGWLTLALLLAGAAGLWWHARLRPKPSNGPAPLPRWLQRRALLVACGLALALFVALAWAIQAESGWWLSRDTATFELLRERIGPGALALLALVTWFGNTSTLIGIGLAVAALLAFKRQWLLLGTWAVGTLGSWTLLVWTKHAFARARPQFLHEVVRVDSYSFPSGHAAGSLVVYGLAAWLALLFMAPRARVPLLLATGLLVAAVSASRVLLQVHYVSDVLAGLLLGLAWLALVVGAAERARRAGY
jgi:membrane-associated phospholipid phosphatase